DFLRALVPPPPNPGGRPLAATDAQQTQILKLHKAGKSLRAIAAETNLGVRTVDTVVGKAKGTDRTSRKQAAKPDQGRKVRRAACGIEMFSGCDCGTRMIPTGRFRAAAKRRELIKEAKGLK